MTDITGVKHIALDRVRVCDADGGDDSKCTSVAVLLGVENLHSGLVTGVPARGEPWFLLSLLIRIWTGVYRAGSRSRTTGTKMQTPTTTGLSHSNRWHKS